MGSFGKTSMTRSVGMAQKKVLSIESDGTVAFVDNPIVYTESLLSNSIIIEGKDLVTINCSGWVSHL